MRKRGWVGPLMLLVAFGGCAELPLPPEVEAAGEPGAAVYTAAGAFQPMAYLVAGGATYVLDDNGRAALSLSADFSLLQAPRSSLFLSNSPDLREAVKVAALKGPNGAQRWTFTVPRGAVWSWAVLWSEDLGVGIARARLVPEGEG